MESIIFLFKTAATFDKRRDRGVTGSIIKLYAELETMEKGWQEWAPPKKPHATGIQHEDRKPEHASRMGDEKITVIPSPKGSGIRMPKVNLPYIIVALIIIAVIVAALAISGANSVSTIGYNKSYTLAQGQAVYFRPGNAGAKTTMLLSNTTNNSAVLYISTVPILLNNAYRLTLIQGEVANVSTNGSQFANLQVRLNYLSGGEASLTLTVIPSDFGVRPSYTVVPLVQPAAATSAAASNASTSTGTAKSTQNSTATAASHSTGNTSPASTPQAILLSDSQVMGIVNTTSYGMLMSKLKAIYVKDSACTSATYNTTYTSLLHSSPAAPYTYSQQLAITPTGLNFSVSHGKGTNYEVAYYTAGRTTAASGPALYLWINSSRSSPVVNATFEGIFSGQDYSVVNSTYNTQAGIASDCAVYIP